MIVGEVRESLPRVSLDLSGQDGLPINVEFILDTGFDGQLTLPTALLSSIDIVYVCDNELRLANGSIQRCPLYETNVNWDGIQRTAEIYILENPPLLGVGLLSGRHLIIEMVDGGEVVIDAL